MKMQERTESVVHIPSAEWKGRYETQLRRRVRSSREKWNIEFVGNIPPIRKILLPGVSIKFRQHHSSESTHVKTEKGKKQENPSYSIFRGEAKLSAFQAVSASKRSD